MHSSGGGGGSEPGSHSGMYLGMLVDLITQQMNKTISRTAQSSSNSPTAWQGYRPTHAVPDYILISYPNHRFKSILMNNTISDFVSTSF